MTRRLELQEDSSRARGDADAAGALNRLQTIFDGASVGIVHIDADGHALDSNAEAQALLGYTREEMLELAFGDVVHPDQQEAQLARHAELVTGRCSAYEPEKRYICARTAAELWAFTRTTAVAAEPGERPTAVVVIQDITERKRDRAGAAAQLGPPRPDRRDPARHRRGGRRPDRRHEPHRRARDGADRLARRDGQPGRGRRALSPARAAWRPSWLHRNAGRWPDSIVRHAIDARDTLLIRDTLSDPRINRKMQARVGDFSLICVPLFAGDEPVAALNVMSRDSDRPARRGGAPDARAARRRAVGRRQPRGGVRGQAPTRSARSHGSRRRSRARVAGMLLADPRGRIVETNAAFQEMLGYDAEALRGREVCGPRRRPRTSDDSCATLTGMAERGDRAGARSSTASCAATARSCGSNSRSRSCARRERRRVVHDRVVQDVTQRRKAEAGAARAVRAQRVPGAPRRAHRPRQPHALPRPHRARDPHRAAHGKQLAVARHGPRPLQGDQRLARPRGGRRAADRGRPAPRGTRCASPTRSPGSAATSSACCSPASTCPPTSLRVDRADAGGDRPSRSTVAGPAARRSRARSASRSSPSDGDDVETLAAARRRRDVPREGGERRLGVLRRGDRDAHDPGRLTLVGELRARARAARAGAATTSRRRSWPTARCARSRRSLRWNHPVRGLVQPDDFIPLAQQTGLIKPLTLLRDRRGAAPVRARGSRTAGRCRSRSTCRRATCSTSSSRPGRRAARR